MITEIGLVSGEILEFLEEEDRPVSIEEIKCHLDEPMNVIDMSLGWLIRENYVRVIRDGQQYLVLQKEIYTDHVTENAVCVV